jgi:hypothetical protein
MMNRKKNAKKQRWPSQRLLNEIGALKKCGEWTRRWSEEFSRVWWCFEGFCWAWKVWLMIDWDMIELMEIERGVSKLLKLLDRSEQSQNFQNVDDKKL